MGAEQDDLEKGVSVAAVDDEGSTSTCPNSSVNSTVDLREEKSKPGVVFETGDGGCKGKIRAKDSNPSTIIDVDMYEETLERTTAKAAELGIETRQPANEQVLQTTQELPEDMMPMPLPPQGLHRHNRQVVPESVPGAQSVQGLGASAHANDPQPAVQQLPPQQEDSEEPEDDTGVAIDGAFLVTPDQEQPNINDSSHHNQEVIVGQVMQRPEKKLSSQTFLLGLLAIVVLGAILLGVVLLVSRDAEDSGDPDLESPSKPEELILYPPFRDDLPNKILDDIATIGHIAYWSNKWMIEDPNLASYPDHRQIQRYMLVAIYYSLNGDNWFNNDGWLDYNIHECEWFHQVSEEDLKDEPLCDEDGNYRMIALASNNLQGPWPDQGGFHDADYLTEIFALDVANNNITGPSPNLLAGSSKVEYVVISNNGFDLVSPGMGNIGKSIRVLKVENNNIVMTANGVAWYFFPGLEIYNITNNQIGGILGPQIGTVKNLTYVGAGHNPWGGTIPSEIGLLKDLVEIDLSGNYNMGGQIPTEMGLLPKLKRIDLRGSNYTGPLPVEFCRPHETEPGEMAVEVLADCDKIECCQ